MREAPIWDTRDLVPERLDDIPLILGLTQRLNLPDLLDPCLRRHHLHQGLSPGGLATVGIGSVLSQADPRTSAVRDGVRTHRGTRERLIGQPSRDADFPDDRLAILRRRLAPAAVRSALKARLGASTCPGDPRPVAQVRRARTTSEGVPTGTEEGRRQRGQSKDHRPALPQLKRRAAAAEPTGMILATEVHPGNTKDDPLDRPRITRVREVLGRRGLLDGGDGKRAALQTRADLQRHGPYYLVPLPLSSGNGARLDQAVTAAVDGAQVGALIWEGPRRRDAGDAWSRRVQADDEVESPDGAERVQVVRSQDWPRDMPGPWSKPWPKPRRRRAGGRPRGAGGGGCSATRGPGSRLGPSSGSHSK